MIWKKTGALFVVLLFAATIVAGAGSAKTVDVSQIEFEQGETDWVNGGQYVGIHAPGMDFRVIYGTVENPRAITIVSSFVRYLGAAEVYNTNGDFRGNVPIPVVTMTAQRLGFLAEFRDSNGNGMMDPQDFRENGAQGREVLRTASLVTYWNLTVDDEVQYPDGSVGWNFTLSTGHLPYTYSVDNASGKSVDKVAFTFHLRAGIKDVRVENVPWYRVEVYEASHGPVVVESNLESYRNYTGTAVNASVKYDHLIEGWDFAGNSSRLFLGTGLTMGNHIPEKTQEWIHTQFIDRINGEGTIGARNGTGNISVDGNFTRPTLIKNNEMHFQDNWERMGNFSWVSNVTLTDRNGRSSEGNVTFSLHRGMPIDRINMKGDIFRGFMVLGGFSYPSAYSIYHDPTFSATAYSFDILKAIRELPAGLLFLQAVIAGVIVIGAVAYRKGKRKAVSQQAQEQNRSPIPPTPEETNGQAPPQRYP